MKEFKKAAVEKKAKQIEQKVSQDVTSDNKSAVRAISRLRAAKELCEPGEDTGSLYLMLIDAFYKGAKYQSSWTEALKKEDPAFQKAMESSLGTPAPRAKKVSAAPATP